MGLTIKMPRNSSNILAKILRSEKFSGKPGEYFTLEETLNGIEEILSPKVRTNG